MSSLRERLRRLKVGAAPDASVAPSDASASLAESPNAAGASHAAASPTVAGRPEDRAAAIDGGGPVDAAGFSRTAGFSHAAGEADDVEPLAPPPGSALAAARNAAFVNPQPARGGLSMHSGNCGEFGASAMAVPLSPACEEEGRLGAAWGRLGVQLHSGEYGSFLKRICAYPLPHRHGRYALGDLVGRAGQLSSLAARELDSHRRLLFFDAETTGLGVGAGNIPFMVGLGYYDDAQFIVEQLFIRHPGEEAEMLRYLQEKLRRFTHIVTYNGRAFDWPVMKNRFVMNRLRLAEEPSPIDLLYPSRSLWKHSLPSCRLGNVEADKLGFIRRDDVPGSLAPALYVQFLAEGDPAVLSGVFRHNELDILSLAGLAIHFAKLLSGDIPTGEPDAEEMYRLALWLDQTGKEELARRFMAQLSESAWHDRHEVLPRVAEWYKKRNQHDLAARLWRRYVDGAVRRASGIGAWVELAKYYEHRLRDYAEALRCAEEALEMSRRRASLMRRGTSQDPDVAELQRRIERLRRKLSRAKPSSLYAGTLV
jgi:hypothetical protein